MEDAYYRQLFKIDRQEQPSMTIDSTYNEKFTVSGFKAKLDRPSLEEMEEIHCVRTSDGISKIPLIHYFEVSYTMDEEDMQ